MPKPFANSAQITYSLVNGDWLLGIQTGNSTGDAGLPQMKHIKLSQLSDWVRGTYGQIWRYRGPFSASLPSDAQANDYFLATATFTVDGVTYTEDHLYAYNASGTWDDISDVLTQYASQAQVTDIDDRLTVVEVKVDAMGDGIVYKGEVATYADLAGIVDPQTGWEYYVTADAAFYVYNGASWDQIDNGIVQTITDGDTAHAPSGDAVYDALAAEAAARTAADSNLKDAIQGNSQRIENLEVAVSGSLVQTNTDASMANTKTITNANSILPWAILKRVGARAVSWNQWCNNTLANIQSLNTAGTWTGDTYAIANVTFKINSDGSITVNGTSSEGSSIYLIRTTQHVTFPQGHKLALTGCPTGVFSGTTGLRFSDDNGQSYLYDNGGGIIVTATGSYYCELVIRLKANLVFSNTVLKPQLTDITAIGEPTLTPSQFKEKFPSLYPYHAPSIIPLNPSAFKVVGKQKWDDEMELGIYLGSTGEPADRNDRIRCVNRISVIPQVQYYVKASTSDIIYMRFYDINDNYFGEYVGEINQAMNQSFTVPQNAFYMRFYLDSSYGTTYNHDILICLNSVTDKTYEEYKETTIDTSFTEDYLYVNENCHDYSENVLVDGVMKRKEHKGIVGEVDLADTSTIVWVAEDSEKRWKTSSLQGIIKNALAGTPANVLGILPTISLDDMTSDQSKIGIAVSATGNVFVRSSANDKGASPTGDFFYEKATPSTPTLHDPIPNITCEDGTTIQAVTPQTDLVNAIDVPSTIAYMTKISS